jgi:hypothetical protein
VCSNSCNDKGLIQSMERLRRITIKNVSLGLLYIIYICLPCGISQPISPNDGVILCQSNCNTTTAYDGHTGRLVGPTQSTETRPYPFSIAPFPSKSKKFCQLGCQLFFEEFPWTVTCKQNCQYYYRYQSTAGYSNIADLAKLECFDGCDIGLCSLLMPYRLSLCASRRTYRRNRL